MRFRPHGLDLLTKVAALLLCVPSEASPPRTALVEQPSPGRFELGYSVAFHDDSQSVGQLSVTSQGMAPTRLRLSGAWFLKDSPLGVAVDGSYERLRLLGNDFDGNPLALPASALRAFAGIAARTRVASSLSVEADVGYAYGLAPTLDIAVDRVAAFEMGEHGPAVALLLGFERGPVSPRLHVRALPYATGASPAGPVSGWLLEAGAEVGLGRIEFGGLDWRPALEYEYGLSKLHGGAGSSSSFSQASHRVGLGLRASLKGEQRLVELPPATGPGTLRGRLIAEGDAAAVAGQPIEVSGHAPVTTGAGGEFFVDAAGPGTVRLKAAVARYQPVDTEVNVAAEEETAVELKLVRRTGPGRLTGLVLSGLPGTKTGRAPLPGVSVEASGTAVLTDAFGRFVFEKVGPGLVALKLTAAGFAKGKEVVSVPEGDEVSIELVLLRDKARAPATIRGLVRAKDGKPLKATLAVVEARVVAETAAGGTFQLTVPGGRYQVVVESPGYLKQTKEVKVADGDEVIFNFDMHAASGP